jgi:hypothetical protein
MIIIKDHRGAVVSQFEGVLAAEVTTDDGERARWIEIALYQREGGGWVIHRLSDSTLYHRQDTTCRTPKQARPGQPATAADLLEGSEPCGQCRPPELSAMRPGDPVRMEIPRHNVWFLDTEQQVVDNLVIDHRTGKAFWSKPVIELLGAVAQEHPHFLALIPRSGVTR